MERPQTRRPPKGVDRNNWTLNGGAASFPEERPKKIGGTPQGGKTKMTLKEMPPHKNINSPYISPQFCLGDLITLEEVGKKK